MTPKFETRPLDDAAREAAPGQFIRLSQGVTHYELAEPLDALNFPHPAGLAGLSMGGPIVAIYAACCRFLC